LIVEASLSAWPPRAPEIVPSASSSALWRWLPKPPSASRKLCCSPKFAEPSRCWVSRIVAP
jgi:hypothetical protein